MNEQHELTFAATKNRSRPVNQDNRHVDNATVRNIDLQIGALRDEWQTLKHRLKERKDAIERMEAGTTAPAHTTQGAYQRKLCEFRAECAELQSQLGSFDRRIDALLQERFEAVGALQSVVYCNDRGQSDEPTSDEGEI
jgi:predicted RNase H-like nuclease (RuvC/YqgF family)